MPAQVTPSLQSPVQGLARLRLHVEQPGHVTRASDPKSLTWTSYRGRFLLSVSWGGGGRSYVREEEDGAAVPRH